jgi:hypothetical protein
MTSFGNGKLRKARSPRGVAGPLADMREENDARLHELKNTLASLRLRLGVVVSDPTCRWAQEDNLTALVRIVDDAMRLARDLRESWQGPAAKVDVLPRRNGKRPRGPRAANS